MNIRHAKTQDTEKIRKIAMETWIDTYSQIITKDSIEKIVDNWYDLEDLNQQVQDKIFYISEIKETPVGFIHASVRNDRAHLHRLYIQPKYQGQGLGSKLYKKAEKQVKKQKADYIELEVLSENKKGLSFYKSLGFEEKEQKQVKLNGDTLKEKVLTKELK